MNDLLKVGLIGVGGYFLYEYLFGTSVPVTTVTSPVQTSPATTTPTTNVMPSAAQLVAKAGSSSQNIYQWNYWYYQLTGRGSTWDAGPPWPVDGSTVIDVNTYLGYLQGMGLSGLGMIIDLEKLFAGVPVGQGFGAREFNAGLNYGLGEIVDDPLMSAGYIDVNPMIEAAAFGGSQSDPTTADFYLAAEGQGT